MRSASREPMSMRCTCSMRCGRHRWQQSSSVIVDSDISPLEERRERLARPGSKLTQCRSTYACRRFCGAPSVARRKAETILKSSTSMIALAARILDLPEPEPLPPLRATARMSRPAAAAQAVVVMPDFIARPGETGGGHFQRTARPAETGARAGAKNNYCRTCRGGEGVCWLS